MSPCPSCAQPGGFHSANCGHFTLPADWRIRRLLDDGDIVGIVTASFDTPAGRKSVRWYKAIPPRPGWIP